MSQKITVIHKSASFPINVNLIWFVQLWECKHLFQTSSEKDWRRVTNSLHIIMSFKILTDYISEICSVVKIKYIKLAKTKETKNQFLKWLKRINKLVAHYHRTLIMSFKILTDYVSEICSVVKIKYINLQRLVSTQFIKWL